MFSASFFSASEENVKVQNNHREEGSHRQYTMEGEPGGALPGSLPSYHYLWKPIPVYPPTPAGAPATRGPADQGTRSAASFPLPSSGICVRVALLSPVSERAPLRASEPPSERFL